MLLDETQLRGKGYDKTPDFVLQVPIGKYLELQGNCVTVKCLDFTEYPLNGIDRSSCCADFSYKQAYVYNTAGLTWAAE